MRFITAIFYNEKGNQFRKVKYCSNKGATDIEAVEIGQVLLEEFVDKNKHAKDIRARTFELDTWSYDLC